MEFTGKKWQLRLLSGLLAIFVTLYFMTDLFGGIRADDSGSDPAAVGEIGESGEDESEIMLLALDDAASGGDQSMLNAPFQITSVTATLNGAPLSENSAVSVKTGDAFYLKFEWKMTDDHTHAFETFSYDLNGDLHGIKLHNVSDPGDSVDYTGDGVPDAYYSVQDNVLTLRILDTKNYTNYEGGFAISGTVDLTGVNKDTDGKFTLHFANKTFTLIDLTDKPHLDVSKSSVDSVTKDGDGYWQKFTVTVSNPSDADAANTVLTDQFGEMFTGTIRNTEGGTFNVNAGNRTFTVGLGTIAAGGSATVSYEMKLDPAKMLSGEGNYNSAASTADNLSYSTTGWANAVYNAPSFSKTGKLSGNGKTITWTITVTPGFLEGENWTVTDRGNTWTKANPVSTTTDANGNTTYTYTLTTDAPAADQYANKTESNTATFTVPSIGSRDFSGSVTIPPTDKTDYIDKTHGTVTVTGDEALVPFKIDVVIPNTDVTAVEIEDELEDTWQYADQTDRIENLYSTFKVTASGKEYRAVAANDGDLYTIAGVGSLKRTWYAENVRFHLSIDDKNFLTQNKGKTITVSYTLDIKDGAISTVRNRATMSATLANGANFPPRSDSDTYRRNVIVTKGQDYSGPASQYGNYARSWKVVVTNNSGASANGNIVITDTLPTGYQLCTKTSGGYELRVVDSSGAAVNATVGTTAGSNVFTVTIPAAGKKSFTLYYTANMTDAHYNSLTKPSTYTYTNRVTATIPNAGSGAAQDTFNVYTSNSELLSKDIISDPSVSSGKFSATYRIEINQRREKLNIAPLTVVDQLGTAMTLVNGSVKVYEISESNQLSAVTPNYAVKSTKDGDELTFTLPKDETHYRIEYGVTGDALPGNELTNTNTSGVTDELKKRFGNTVKYDAGNRGMQNSSIMLSDQSYRQSAYISFSLKIEGKKDWKDLPAGTAQPTNAEFQITRTEKKIDGTVASAGTYTFFLEQGQVVAGTGTGGFQPRVRNNGTDWSFIIDNLMLRDATIGSDYTYQLSEITAPGYAASYQYRTDPANGWKPVANAAVGMDSGAILQEQKSGAIEVWITNTYTGSEPASAEISFQKVDSTNRGKTLAGAKFELTAGTGSLKDATADPAFDSKSDQKATFTTTNGLIRIGGLPAGTYTLHESAAPAGYVANRNDFRFTVGADGQIRTQSAGGYTYDSDSATVTAGNAPTEIGIEKFAVGGSEQLPDAVLSIAGTGVDLTGVSVANAAANSVVKSRTTVSFKTTDKTAYITGLPAGHYTLTETAAPGEYEITSSFGFTVNPNGSATPDAGNGTDEGNTLSGNTITLYDAPKTGSITIVKNDGAGAALAGAKFRLTSRTAGVRFGGATVTDAKAGYTTISAGSIEFTTDGKAIEIGKLPIGQYLLTETEAPDGCSPADDFLFEIALNADGTVSAKSGDTARFNAGSETATLVNETIVPNTLQIAKRGDGGALLAGAEFTIGTANGNLSGVTVNIADDHVQKSEKTLVFQTTNAGTVKITGLPAGTYTVTETDVPSGYIKDNSVFEFTVAADGTVAQTQAGNYVFNGARATLNNKITEIQIAKTDMTGAEQLSGATLTIAKDGADSRDLSDVKVENATGIRPGADEVVFVTGKSTATVKGLPAGAYVLTETAAPDGYKITTEFRFTVNADGTATPDPNNGADEGNALSGNTITLYDKPIEINIDKTDLGGTHLSDAVIEIRNTDGKSLGKVTVTNAQTGSVQQSASSDTLSFMTGAAVSTLTGLPAGHYELTETAAPDGYEKLKTAFLFQIDKNGRIIVTATAEPVVNIDVDSAADTIAVKDEPKKSSTTPTDPDQPENPGQQPSNPQQPVRPSNPGGTQPGGNSPSGTTSTTTRSTLTEPDETEPEQVGTKKTTSGTVNAPDGTGTKTEKTKKTTAKTTTAPETALPETTGTTRTEDGPDSEIDSDRTHTDENPYTGVTLAPLAALFAGAGILAAASRKKKRK